MLIGSLIHKYVLTCNWFSKLNFERENVFIPLFTPSVTLHVFFVYSAHQLNLLDLMVNCLSV